MGALDEVTQQLLQAKDEEVVRLAETVLRLVQIFDYMRSVDRDTRIRVETLEPEIQHALRTYNRLTGVPDQQN